MPKKLTNREKLLKRLSAGKVAASVEARLWRIAYGKPQRPRRK